LKHLEVRQCAEEIYKVQHFKTVVLITSTTAKLIN